MTICAILATVAIAALAYAATVTIAWALIHGAATIERRSK